MFLHERGRCRLNPWSHPSRPARHWMETKTDRIAVPRMRSFRPRTRRNKYRRSCPPANTSPGAPGVAGGNRLPAAVRRVRNRHQISSVLLKCDRYDRNIVLDRDNGLRVDKAAVMDKKVLFGTLLLALSFRKGGRGEPENGNCAFGVKFTGGIACDVGIIFLGDARR
jgi:hypothetical protein